MNVGGGLVRAAPREQLHDDRGGGGERATIFDRGPQVELCRALRAAQVLDPSGRVDNHQSALINQAVREYVEEMAEPLEDKIRRVVREEVARYGKR